MFVLPLDAELCNLCLLFTGLFELLRIAVVAFQCGKSSALIGVETERQEIQFKISSIKSVQQELTSWGKLSRKEIEVKKKIDRLTEDQTLRGEKLVKIFRYVRFVLYGGFIALIFCLKNYSLPPLVVVDAANLYPFSYIIWSEYYTFSPVTFVILTALAWRYLYRTTIMLVYKSLDDFP